MIRVYLFAYKAILYKKSLENKNKLSNTLIQNTELAYHVTLRAQFAFR